MPFQSVTPRPFTPLGIRSIAPADGGVYGISNAREWIYIGESDNIQRSLMEHLAGSEATLENWSPTGFVYEVCGQAIRASRQDRLVLEYEPACNRLSPGHRRNGSQQ